MKENSVFPFEKLKYGRPEGHPSRFLLAFLLAFLMVLLLVPLLAACGGSEDSPEDPGPGPGPDVPPIEATLPAVEEQETEQSTPLSSEPTFASTQVPTATPSPPPAPLAAVVNGQYILLSDYERQVAIYERALEDQGFDLDSEEGKDEARQIHKNILDGLIDSALMRQEAERMGLTISAEELDAQVMEDIEEGGGQEAFEEWLEVTGQTRADYREMLYDLMLSDLVLETLAETLPEEAEQVHVRHIAVSSAEAAQEIVAQIQQGADFEELAAEYSEDSWTKDEGGDLGWFPAGIMAPEMEQAAFALQVGEVTVVPIEGGYHVIELLDREADRPVPADLKMDLELAAFEQWLESLRATALIERFVDQ